MSIFRPSGPRTRAAPALSLSISGSSNTDTQDTDISLNSQNQPPHIYSASTPHNAALSPSSTPRFNGSPPVLNTPVPKKKPHGGPQPRVRIDVGGLSGNGGEGEQSTIRPEATYSPHEKPRRPFVGSMIGMVGAVPPVFPSSVGREDPMITIREAVNQISIGYAANSNHNVAMTHSPEGSSRSSPGSISNGRNDQHGFPPPVKPKEFSDEAFEVLSRLGEGAGGAVHHVLDKRDGAAYARKTITTREVSTRQVVRELNIITTTSHVNIVQCFGAYMSPSSSEVKIVMEYCDGQSLEAIGSKLKERNAIIGEKIAGRIAEGVLQGLAYLHTRRTIHRDIKPSNILLSREGIVKLCDFGVSGELTVESLVGTFTGTLIYMAPERVSGGEYTVRSDVWSTGLSLLELVLNRFPYPADLSTIELIMMITSTEPPSLKDDPEANITWSEDMKDFIRQALIREPRSRPTPREMLDHPWIRTVMNHEDNMTKWIRQVWGWPKPGRHSRKNTGTGRHEDNGDSDGGSLSRSSPADR